MAKIWRPTTHRLTQLQIRNKLKFIQRLFGNNFIKDFPSKMMNLGHLLTQLWSLWLLCYCALKKYFCQKLTYKKYLSINEQKDLALLLSMTATFCIVYSIQKVSKFWRKLPSEVIHPGHGKPFWRPFMHLVATLKRSNTLKELGDGLNSSFGDWCWPPQEVKGYHLGEVLIY